MNKKERNKRLGQYFTGKELAKVLFEIARKINPNIESAVDPMMGNGDMLAAILESDNEVKTYGIELDRQLKNQIEDRFNSETKIIFGNTFEKNSLDKLEKDQFDLVITNPPYVRHLNQKNEFIFENFNAPSNSQIRKELINNLQKNKSLQRDEKDFLIRITKNYSGLSDLSVPSIIQCAALTKANGVIALVIPESCITREYSLETLLTLFKLFDVKVIVKDEKRKWFNDAQVKTLLLVGKKLNKPRTSLNTHPKISIIEINNSNSQLPLGENIFSKDYRLFASSVFEAVDSISKLNDFNQYFSSVNSYLSPLLFIKNSIKKYPELESISITKPKLDERLEAFVGYNDFIKLDDLAIEINQGLRTGANTFFYYDFISETEGISKVSFNHNSKSKKIEIPNYCLKTVLRKQNEILEGYFISKSNLKGRVLVLNHCYTSRDIQKFNLNGESVVELPSKVSKHIDYCETLNIGSDILPKYFPDLSAVRTNVSVKNGIRKSWYHLPELKHRHLPDICIPRVNSKMVRSFTVEKDVVVDANFLTIKITPDSKLSKYGLIALLNSDWIKIQLEISGNVLGGGALKLDRNHLLNLLVPSILLSEINTIERFGQELVFSQNNEATLAQINHLINSWLTLNDNNLLNSFLKNLLKRRINNG